MYTTAAIPAWQAQHWAFHTSECCHVKYKVKTQLLAAWHCNWSLSTQELIWHIACYTCSGPLLVVHDTHACSCCTPTCSLVLSRYCCRHALQFLSTVQPCIPQHQDAHALAWRDADLSRHKCVDVMVVADCVDLHFRACPSVLFWM